MLQKKGWQGWHVWPAPFPYSSSLARCFLQWNPHLPAPPPSADDAGRSRMHSRMLRAPLLARIHEVLPLLCPVCAGEPRIIFFVTLESTLLHLDLPHPPPRISPARSGSLTAPPGRPPPSTSPARRLLARAEPTSHPASSRRRGPWDRRSMAGLAHLCLVLPEGDGPRPEATRGRENPVEPPPAVRPGRGSRSRRIGSGGFASARSSPGGFRGRRALLPGYSRRGSSSG
jgi:hypothetical protein